MKTVSIFVDVQNIYYTVKQIYQCHFDYNFFWNRATENREIIVSIAYAIAREDERQKRFQNILRAIGFVVKVKPYISRSDGSSKGDWDVGLAIDVLEYVPKSDVIVLVTGDGDFSILLEHISAKYSVECEVYGVEALTSASLMKVASRFIPIEDKFLL